MKLHLYYLDRRWTKRGDCAHNYNLVVDLDNKTYKIYVSPFYGYECSSDIEVKSNLVVDLDNKTYKIYVSPFYGYECSSDIEVKRKSDILNYIEYLKENGFVDTDEIYCG